MDQAELDAPAPAAGAARCVSLTRQKQLLANLGRLIAERAQSERSIQASQETRRGALQAQLAEEQARLAARLRDEHDQLQARHVNELSALAQGFEGGLEEVAAAHERTYHETIRATEHSIQQADDEFEASRTRLDDQRGDALADADLELRTAQQQLVELGDKLDAAHQRALKIVRRRWCLGEARRLSNPAGQNSSGESGAAVRDHLARLDELIQGFDRHWAPKFVWSGWLVVIFVFSLLPAVVLGGWLNLLDVPWIIGSIGVALGVTAIVMVLVRPVMVWQTLQQYAAVLQTVADVRQLLTVADAAANARAVSRRQMAEELARLSRETAAENRNTAIRQAQQRREQRLQEAADRLQRERGTITARREIQVAEVNARFEQLLREQRQQHDAARTAFQERSNAERTAARQTFERSWQRLVDHWRTGLHQLHTETAAMRGYLAAVCPAWSAVDWSQWIPPGVSLPAIAFGSFQVDLAMFEHGLPAHPDLQTDSPRFDFPAAVSFHEHSTLLLETWGDGRQWASQVQRQVMLRLLTSLPPGKVRFTILDPLGLGQNFSAFMHLADFHEQLVNHRIWTESGHIQQRLADLTEHMEDVIQTYLRNEFASIDDYNRDAGEIAEPFHILVVANFPQGFTAEATQRLLSIVASGARCGVYTLISCDMRLELPRGFDVADLESHAVTLQWDGRRFRWRDEELRDLPLELDQPPDEGRFSAIVRQAGARAKDALRVEVPFATVAAEAGVWWTADSRGGVQVALGKAGATKLQHLRLGHGTAQHVLISGKTGSGKSTLLHALITNTALHYSPDEVEFYLIDFKKGVEFKPYATYRLPHARVVAIESEREFGLSVLERLDRELQQRGELFRQHGVQDIRQFRDQNPGVALPRILLVIDEFQEFFVQDDKLAQESSLLLDRLVRQGRAFGIHVLLGSQTLAGAYTLARSTIGQMAVRIALQCSEADSHLILSEDNTAARLLNRPGEAIYNDANGLFEGNHPFQVVWLAAQEQEQYLQQLRSRAEQIARNGHPLLVFEGNAAANPLDNDELRAAIDSPPRAPAAAVPRIWLGAAISIKEPTSVFFRRQSGSNLLLVGQQEESALGILTNAVIALAATSRAAGRPRPRFIILDGARPGDWDGGRWTPLTANLPLDATCAGPRDAPAALADLHAELQRRLADADPSAPPQFLVVYQLSRFRELRRGEDDFSFSLSDDQPSARPDKQLAAVLRDGPNVGLHCLIWCDTYTNLSRWFDRQTLRELDHRVLFQMSASDSANLIDSPAASRLGVHRGLYVSEEHGGGDKFRPYGPIPDEWLAWVRDHLEAPAFGPAS